MGATVTIPQDRLGKLPRRVVVGIYLDDQLAEIHGQAVGELESARMRLEGDRGRRIAAGKSAPEAAGETADAVVADVDAGIAAELAPLEESVDVALVALDAATMWFTFRSLGRKRWRALVAEHAPTDADHDAVRRESGNEAALASWNAETLAPVIVARACISRVLDGAELGPLGEEDVEAIWEGEAWNDTEIQALFITALVAQTQGRAVSHRPAPTAAALTG